VILRRHASESSRLCVTSALSVLCGVRSLVLLSQHTTLFYFVTRRSIRGAILLRSFQVSIQRQYVRKSEKRPRARRNAKSPVRIVRIESTKDGGAARPVHQSQRYEQIQLAATLEKLRFPNFRGELHLSLKEPPISVFIQDVEHAARRTKKLRC
jgi:hypothetical protein